MSNALRMYGLTNSKAAEISYHSNMPGDKCDGGMTLDVHDYNFGRIQGISLNHNQIEELHSFLGHWLDEVYAPPEPSSGAPGTCEYI